MTGRGFAGNRRFIDRGNALDHVAVARNDVAGLANHQVACPQFVGGDGLKLVELARRLNALGTRFGTRLAQGIGLRLAPPFRDSFGKIGEQYGEPQPENDLEFERDVAATGKQIADEDARSSAP